MPRNSTKSNLIHPSLPFLSFFYIYKKKETQKPSWCFCFFYMFGINLKSWKCLIFLEIIDLDRSLLIKPSSTAYYNLGITLYQLKLLPESIKAWNQSLDLNPNSSDVHTNLASAYILSQPAQPHLALHHLKMAVQLDPTDGEIRFNLAAVNEASWVITFSLDLLIIPLLFKFNPISLLTHPLFFFFLIRSSSPRRSGWISTRSSLGYHQSWSKHTKRQSNHFSLSLSLFEIIIKLS